MSNAIEHMMAEHRVIEGVMSSLEAFVSSADAEPARLAQYVEFFVSYADALHHSKEEDILFVMMVDHGFSRESGPVAVMLHEHEQGRALVAELRAASERDEWSDSDRETVASTAHQFISLLRNHIVKEDNVLYPMALARLPSVALAALDDRCASADASHDQRTRLERLAATLTQ